MPITILQPKPAPRRPAALAYDSDADSDSSGGIDLDGDVAMTAHKADTDLVTPGELITDDPQWMRYALPSYPLPYSPTLLPFLYSYSLHRSDQS